MAARILVVDNYDSFVYNLVQYLYQLGAECDVVRNDAIGVEAAHDYDGILLSPGPGVPEQAGVCVDMVGYAAEHRIPVFGVCLGLQSIAVAYGAVVGRAPELLHGKTSLVTHDGAGVFAGVPDPFTATRYHSLAIEPDTLPTELAVTAPAGTPASMGIPPRELPIGAVQFHREWVLTESGHGMLANWLTVGGDAEAVDRSAGLAPVVISAAN